MQYGLKNTSLYIFISFNGSEIMTETMNWYSKMQHLICYLTYDAENLIRTEAKARGDYLKHFQ